MAVKDALQDGAFLYQLLWKLSSLLHDLHDVTECEKISKEVFNFEPTAFSSSLATTTNAYLWNNIFVIECKVD